MKRKYLLRGIGIGVILSSLFFVIFGRNLQKNITDDEIRKRAGELGMVTAEEMAEKNLGQLKEKMFQEETLKKEKSTGAEQVASEDSTKSGNSGKEEQTPSNQSGEGKLKETDSKENQTGSSEQEEKDSSEAGTTGKESDKGKKTTSDSKEEAETKTGNSGKNSSEIGQETGKEYTYTVIPNSSAVTLCRDFEAMGLIKDARDFNEYLAVNDYARKIKRGTFTFYENEDYYSMAMKLINGKTGQ